MYMLMFDRIPVIRLIQVKSFTQKIHQGMNLLRRRQAAGHDEITLETITNT